MSTKTNIVSILAMASAFGAVDLFDYDRDNAKSYERTVPTDEQATVDEAQLKRERKAAKRLKKTSKS